MVFLGNNTSKSMDVDEFLEHYNDLSDVVESDGDGVLGTPDSRISVITKDGFEITFEPGTTKRNIHIIIDKDKKEVKQYIANNDELYNYIINAKY